MTELKGFKFTFIGKNPYARTTRSIRNAVRAYVRQWHREDTEWCIIGNNGDQIIMAWIDKEDSQMIPFDKSLAIELQAAFKIQTDIPIV